MEPFILIGAVITCIALVEFLQWDKTLSLDFARRRREGESRLSIILTDFPVLRAYLLSGKKK